MASRDNAPVTVSPALPRPVRAAAGIAALVIIIFGVLAIFDEHDGAATAALLIIGAAFGLMALTGYAITRIKAGDYEVMLEASQLREARLAFARGDEEGERAILQSLVRQPAAAGVPMAAGAAAPVTADARAAAADAYAHQRLVLEVVLRVLPADAELHEREAALSGVEAFIEFPEGTRIGIDIRAGTRFDFRAVADRMSAALAYARPELAGLIVIVRSSPGDRRARELQTLAGKLQAPVVVVTWAPDDPDDAIREAIMHIIPHVR